MTAAAWLDAFTLPAGRGRVLILVAHPDDETIGAGGLLLTAATTLGLEVTLLHVTDGAPRDGGDAAAAGCADWQAYAALRRRELAAALGLAGLKPGAVNTLGYPDQQAALNLAELTDRVRRHLLRCLPDVVLTHTYEGGHPDHDATCFAVYAAVRLLCRARRPAPRIVEMPFYRAGPAGPVHQSFLPGGEGRVRTVFLGLPEQALKRRMLALFASQSATLAPIEVKVERFRRGSWPAFTRPAHEGRLLYEEWGLGLTAARWCTLADQALAELGLGAERWV